MPSCQISALCFARVLAQRLAKSSMQKSTGKISTMVTMMLSQWNGWHCNSFGSKEVRASHMLPQCIGLGGHGRVHLHHLFLRRHLRCWQQCKSTQHLSPTARSNPKGIRFTTCQVYHSYNTFFCTLGLVIYPHIFVAINLALSCSHGRA